VRFFLLVAKNARRNVRRTLLTISSVAVSLFMLCTLLTVLTELGRQGGGESAYLRLVVQRATSLADPLPESYRQKLETVPGVVLVHPMNWFGGIYQDERNFFANVATDARTLLQMFPEYRVEPDQARTFIRERTAALVGRKLIERFGWVLGGHVTLLGTVYPVDLECTIRAIYTGDAEDTFFFHQEYLDEALGRPGVVRTFRLKARSAADIPRIITAVDEMFRNTPAETKTETERSFQLGFVAMLGNITGLVETISTVLVFTVLFVTANTAAMAIRERVVESAILKTLGFRRGLILAVLVAESVWIALVGGLVGAIGARIVFQMVDMAHFTHGLFRAFVVTKETVIVALGVATAIGVASATLPAYRATGTAAAEAFRRVG